MIKKDDTKNLSIICISYFSKHLLGKLIENISATIACKTELIIVNNSKEEKLCFDQSWVKVYCPGENLGYGAGINFGVKMSSFQNLLIINPDIKLNKFTINFDELKGEYFCGGFRNNKPFGFSFPNQFKDTVAFIIPPLKSFSRSQIMCSKSKKTSVDWITGSLILTNKESMRIIGGFNEDYFLFYEEVDLCKRAEKVNMSVFVHPDINYVASSKKEKSSSIDVRWMKLNNEIRSFFVYYSSYSRSTTLAKNSISFFSKIALCFFKLLRNSTRVNNIQKYYATLIKVSNEI